MSDLTEKIRSEFPQRKVVIVGDLVADQFLHGTITRVSREAPVFILRHDETETFAGGAANAAVNVASLGAKATVVGVIGKDENGEKLLGALQKANVDCSFAVLTEEIKTTAKVRVLAGHRHTQLQQLVRIDYENSNLLNEKIVESLRKSFLTAVKEANAVIISDYDYGVADSKLADIIGKTCREMKIPLIIDSRFRLRNFPGATSATPNQEEAEALMGENFTAEDCIKLCKELGYESLLITCGNQGMILVEKHKTPLKIEAVGAKEPVDVTGAGDTVIAGFALGLASGLSFAESAHLANHAGGIVVMKKGTACVTVDELLDSLENHGNFKLKTKKQ